VRARELGIGDSFIPLQVREGPWLRIPIFAHFSDILSDGAAIWFRHAAGASRLAEGRWTHAIRLLEDVGHGGREATAMGGGRLFVARPEGLFEFVPDGGVRFTPLPAKAESYALWCEDSVLWWASLGPLGSELRVERRDLREGAPP
jgi:hypothetical protein